MATKIRYPLNQSPLFKLSSKKKMCEVLGVDLDQLPKLVTPSNYHVFMNRRGREVQHPVGALAKIHTRIARLLARITLPTYVHSQKGRSYITNAAAHSVKQPLVKTDIAKFYPSTSFSTIFSLFRDQFSCSQDVAWQLAKMCCYRDHLPTGSPISGYVAFLSHQKLFDKISALAQSHKCVMTLLVDDISMSGAGATKALLFESRRMIRASGLKTKNEKSKTFPANKPRIVTGIVVAEGGLRTPNARHLEIHKDRRRLEMATSQHERSIVEASLRGRLQEVRNVSTVSSSLRTKLSYAISSGTGQATLG